MSYKRTEFDKLMDKQTEFAQLMIKIARANLHIAEYLDITDQPHWQEIDESALKLLKKVQAKNFEITKCLTEIKNL